MYIHGKKTIEVTTWDSRPSKLEHFARPQVLNKRALHSTCSSRPILSGERLGQMSHENAVGWLASYG